MTELASRAEEALRLAQARPAEGLSLALEVAGERIPVIHDSHDLQSLRRTPYEDGFDDPDDPESLEKEAVERLNKGIALCVGKGDNGSRELLEKILTGEESSVEWLEAQLHIVGEIGKEPYLAEQIHE